MLKIINQGPKVDDSELIFLEERIGKKLPPDYRKFLFENNGGTPAPGVFKFYNTISEKEDESGAHQFLSLEKKEYDSIYNMLKVFKNRIPRNFLPIARDSGRGVIVMDLTGKGEICFWDPDYEAEDGEEPRQDNIYHISNNFSEFLHSLYEIEDF